MGRENSVNQRKPIRVPISDLERAIRCVQNRYFRFPLYHRPVRAGQPAEVESGLRTRDSFDRFFHKDFVVKYLRPILAHSVRITAHPLILPGAGRNTNICPSFLGSHQWCLSDPCAYTASRNPPRPTQSYAINQTAANEYVENQCGETARTIARTLVENIRYIPQEEFEIQLRKSVDSFNKIIQSLPSEDREYVIVVPSLIENGKKSNHWVTDLALPLLTPPPRALIQTSCLDDFPTIKRVALFDDAIYSGLQMGGYVVDLARAFGKTVHLVVPFITEHGKKYILSIAEAEFADHHKIAVIEEILPESLHAKVEQMYMHTHKPIQKAITYFGHKRADGISVLSDFLNGKKTNEITTEEEEQNDRSLGKNCKKQFSSVQLVPYPPRPYEGFQWW